MTGSSKMSSCSGNLTSSVPFVRTTCTSHMIRTSADKQIQFLNCETSKTTRGRTRTCRSYTPLPVLQAASPMETCQQSVSLRCLSRMEQPPIVKKIMTDGNVLKPSGNHKPSLQEVSLVRMSSSKTPGNNFKHLSRSNDMPLIKQTRKQPPCVPKASVAFFGPPGAQTSLSP